MEFGLHNNRFYIDVPSCRWEPKDFRTETDRHLLELYEGNPKLLLGMSTGLDSQVLIRSALDQGIPLEYVFMYLPGYNEFEYSNLEYIKKRFEIKVEIVDYDVEAIKGELLAVSDELGIHPNQCLHRKLLSDMPDDYDFLQGIDGPFTIPTKGGSFFYYEGWNSYEISRYRAFKTLNRKGKNHLFDRSSEMLLSILQDDLYRGFMYSGNYYTTNGLGLKNSDVPSKINTNDRWDYYIKPLFYGKYYTDELLYFPKYQGPEGIDYIMERPHAFGKQSMTIPAKQLMTHLAARNGKTQRYYENITYDSWRAISSLNAIPE